MAIGTTMTAAIYSARMDLLIDQILAERQAALEDMKRDFSIQYGLKRKDTSSFTDQKKTPTRIVELNPLARRAL